MPCRLLLPPPSPPTPLRRQHLQQCDNFTTSTEFLPQLLARLADSIELRDDAEARGSHSEVARHARVIASLQRHLTRLAETTPTTTQA